MIAGRGNRLGSIPVGQIPSGKAAERSRIAAVAQPLPKMLDAEPAIEVARRVPVKHLKIDRSQPRSTAIAASRVISRRPTPFPRAARATNRSSRYTPGRPSQVENLG